MTRPVHRAAPRASNPVAYCSYLRDPLTLRSVGAAHVFHGDALTFVDALEHEVADLIFVDPPFNLGKLYGSSNRRADRLTEDAYFVYMQQLLRGLTDALKPGGSLFLYHLPRWALRFGHGLSERLTFRHWIAISMKNGFARGQRLYPAHYALLYFTKGQPLTFRRPKVQPARCRHCAELLKDYGGYLKFIKDGVNLSDVWEDLSPVRHKRHKTRSSNELCADIPRRILAMSGKRRGLFVDPFAGSGTAVVSALQAGMKVIAADRERQHCDLIVKRVAALR